MSKKVIPVTDLRLLNTAPAVPQQPVSGSADGPLSDTLGRPLHDLRISVTDRCNFRCTYCMPKEVFDKNYRFLPHSALLSFEEITRIARAFIAQGVRKIRLTGGEPLLRKDLPVLVGMLSSLRTPDGEPPELTLTTNGSLLSRKAAELKQAGLKRVTVSLDALDDGIFKTMNDADFPVQAVLEGIEEAQRVGLAPIKVNMVVKRGVNEQEILPMARRFRGSSIELRYIEYMDVGSTNQWRLDEVVPSSEVRRILSTEFPIEPIGRSQASETAERWRFGDGAGHVGFISSVTRAFCHDCNRARLSTEGKLFLCLFGHQGYDLGTPLRQGASDEEIEQRIRSIWSARTDRYSELRSAATREAAGAATNEAESSDAPHKVEMHYIGG